MPHHVPRRSILLKALAVVNLVLGLGLFVASASSLASAGPAAASCPPQGNAPQCNAFGSANNPTKSVCSTCPANPVAGSKQNLAGTGWTWGVCQAGNGTATMCPATTTQCGADYTCDATRRRSN